METTQIGPKRRQWKTNDPLAAALLDQILDQIHEEIWANVKPFLKEERQLLGVDQEASKREVKNAYRRHARKLHPDVGGDETAFKQLHEAYRKVLAAAKN